MGRGLAARARTEWLAFDPTNDQWANDRYVTVAWGRDYGDVPPVKGVIFTEAKKSTLRVAVDVSPSESLRGLTSIGRDVRASVG